MLALCPNTSEVHIYGNCHDADTGKWELLHVLKQHDLLVSGMDWHGESNRIVTCSHDRNAFVWNWDAAAGKWSPQMVVMSQNRACLDVKWSSDGHKFILSTGARRAFLVVFDAEQNWWVPRELKKFKSSVVAAAFHPSGLVAAASGTDYTVRVLPTVVTEFDGEPPASTPFGPFPRLDDGRLAFDAEMLKLEEGRAWVNDVAWSPSGLTLAFASHDSQLRLVFFNADGSAPAVQAIKCPTLPATRLLFLSEAALVCVGHSLNPEVYTRAPDGAWKFLCYLDRKPEVPAERAAELGSAAAARAVFAARTTKGQAGPPSAEGELWTKHINAITGLQAHARSASGAITRFSTSGMDGRVAVWDIRALAAAHPDIDLAALGLA